MAQEFQFIQRIRATAPGNGAVLGIGDDCAVWHPGAGFDQLVSTDLLIEEVHFDLSHGSLAQLGARSLAVNLSDIAAMGGAPCHATLGLALPGADPNRFLPLVEGFCEMARGHGVTLAGGDTCSSPGPLMISVTIFGEVPQGSAVRRSGARPDDLLYVTGSLGDSAMGLSLLRDPAQAPPEAVRALTARHLSPTPRIAAGQFLREAGASAMIDVSDGLLQDLGHILEESGVGAWVEGTLLPLSPSLQSVCATLERDPLPLAAGGGEDYELLCAVPPEKAHEVEQCASRTGVPLTRIGAVRREAGLEWRINGRATPPPASGYEHFA
ncbi:MAG: thiamine-phosphate kinase [Nitrospirota bacterium]|nr:thiamine-phosphate kinase [Nitrospirota bacterium]